MKIAVVLALVLLMLLTPTPVVPDGDPGAAAGRAPATAGPAPGRPDGDPLPAFVPTEKVSAERSVSFPVDI
jgi:hypothetical protein